MKRSFPLLAVLAGICLPGVAAAACDPGVYGDSSGRFVVLGMPDASSAQRYLFIDGQRGNSSDADGHVRCDGNVVSVKQPDGVTVRWPRLATRETRTSFTSWNTVLAGQLIEAPGPSDSRRPLVVMVHGSEKTPWINSGYAFALAAQGVSVFVYDKRGTGASAGDYTQNFELLADDAAAALVEARKLAAGRFGRAGFFGGSQGGWVAPLAATRTPADFVAVGFGLVASPIDEDREQMLQEADAAGLDAKAHDQIRRLSGATAGLVRSHFERGYEALAAIKREVGDAPWARTIEGEYSGDMLRTDEVDLRRVGRARFDNLELIWDYDAVATLRKLRVPLLWVLAGEDREAPITTTRPALLARAAAGQPIDVYLFPGTDHGMVEFRANPDGTRTATRITDGYLRLLADWMKQNLHGAYGRAERLSATAYRTMPPAAR